MLKLYRAVKSVGFKEYIAYPESRRIPGNVPYLVDNLWEWLRPERFPSRRKAAYASPTPELARAGAGVMADNCADFVVATVTLPRTAKIAQIQDSDARLHSDVKELPRAILKHLGTDWTELAVDSRLDFAPLFLPVISKEEVDHAMHRIVNDDKLGELIKKTSTFWQDAAPLTANAEQLAYAEGEIFFEAFDGYHLNRIGDAQECLEALPAG